MWLHFVQTAKLPRQSTFNQWSKQSLLLSKGKEPTTSNCSQGCFESWGMGVAHFFSRVSEMPNYFLACALKAPLLLHQDFLCDIEMVPFRRMMSANLLPEKDTEREDQWTVVKHDRIPPGLAIWNTELFPSNSGPQNTWLLTFSHLSKGEPNRTKRPLENASLITKIQY